MNMWGPFACVRAKVIQQSSNLSVYELKKKTTSNDFIENTLIQASNCINGSFFVLHNGLKHTEY